MWGDVELNMVGIVVLNAKHKPDEFAILLFHLLKGPINLPFVSSIYLNFT